MKKYIIVLILTAVSTLVYGQEAINRSCATMDLQEKNLHKHPELIEKAAQIEAQTARYTSLRQLARVEAGQVTIPVVVHVLYNTNTQNITDAIIQSQIDILNKDYTATNTDISKVPPAFQSIIGNPNFQFALAKRNPSGALTNGIIRVQTSKTSFAYNLDDAKHSDQGGDDAWPSGKYLNIWVVPKIVDGSKTVLGYATLPGQSSADEDGVVIAYQYFGANSPSGTFNLGRTATHEIGHWLNLLHTFQDGCSGMNSTTCLSSGDKVCDTPPTANSNFQCPPTQNSCPESPVDRDDMTMNFLDYVNDACMYMFSAGQATRMQAAINGPRQSILTSDGLTPPASTPTLDAGIENIFGVSGQLCTNAIVPSFSIRNFGLNTITNIQYTYKIDNEPNQTASWTGSLMSSVSMTIDLPYKSGLTAGNHSYEVNIIQVNGQSDNEPGNDILATTFNVPLAVNLPYSESFESGNQLTEGWEIYNPDGSFGWEVNDTAASDGQYSISVNNFKYDYGNGETDDLITPLIGINNDSKLHFDVAYKLYTPVTDSPNYSDTLTVLASTDCYNYTEIYKEAGQDLTTGTPYYTNVYFVPTAGEWTSKTIDLAPYAGKYVRFIFRNTSDNENVLYLDNIRFTGTPLSTSDPIVATESITLYPNPSHGIFTVQAEKPITSISIHDVLGRTVREFKTENNNSQEINLANETSGVYLVKISTGSVIKVLKVIID